MHGVVEGAKCIIYAACRSAGYTTKMTKKLVVLRKPIKSFFGKLCLQATTAMSEGLWKRAMRESVPREHLQ